MKRPGGSRSVFVKDVFSLRPNAKKASFFLSSRHEKVGTKKKSKMQNKPFLFGMLQKDEAAGIQLLLQQMI